ncbi:hypothetical protein [Thermophilibacter mediterraneus]|uniref:hypothetical protein n=1 Tax=Thermophilibacter mediterraneus TaxID=1871031 RepID=UPI00101ADE4B|nr:hypothetical protein [Thermophilibacter mediterraneus]
MSERTIVTPARGREGRPRPERAASSRRRPAATGGATPRRPRATEAAARGARTATERLAGAVSWAMGARRLLVCVGVALVVLVALYGPARDLYCAWRLQDGKQETLDGLNQSIDEYQQDIDRLQTREGIEDEARKRGYVSEGETGVIAEGLPEDQEAEEAPAELPWYLAVGDFVFQYKEQ